MRRDIEWRTAEPLWSTVGAGTGAPAVLRFASDDFMKTLASSVACGGGGLASLVAGHETWRDQGAGLGTDYERDVQQAIRLFQPMQARFYLVTASLVCKRYGHPDRAVDDAADESVAYVLRRLEPKGEDPVDVSNETTYVEYGWSTAVGSGAWLRALDRRLVADEERLPLFPVHASCGGGRRRLHTGLLPVSRRETYESHPRWLDENEFEDEGADDSLAAITDPRRAELAGLVSELQHLRAVPDPSSDADPPVTALPVTALREWLFSVMVDLAAWLKANHLQDALAGDDAELGLHRTYGNVDNENLTWGGALWLALKLGEDAFDDDTPELVNLDRTEIRDRISQLLFGRSYSDVDHIKLPTVTTLFLGADAALPKPEEPAPDEQAYSPEPDAEKPPLPATTTDGAVYVARFLYERPHCRPTQRLVLSDATRPFRFAQFYDPDAPSRPVRIPMPVDMSPAGLRRFPKNVSVVLSSELRKQVEQVSEATLNEGKLKLKPADGITFGTICQLSIPIITICALILLMIMVSILHMVFWWIPLFKVCLPLPPRGDGS